MNEVNFTLKHCYVLVTGSTTLTGILTPVCVGFFVVVFVGFFCLFVCLFLLLKQRKKNSLLEFETLDLTSHLVSVMIKKKLHRLIKNKLNCILINLLEHSKHSMFSG